jgi:uncharacterized integral membrane protein
MESARPTEEQQPTTPETAAPAAGTTAAPAAGTTAAPVQPHEKPVKRTRASGAWNGLIAGAVLLLLLLIFILQNTQKVKISYLGLHGHLPLGVALLLAAVAGALIAGLVGGARILQLRKAAKRADRRATGAVAS